MLVFPLVASAFPPGQPEIVSEEEQVHFLKLYLQDIIHEGTFTAFENQLRVDHTYDGRLGTNLPEETWEVPCEQFPYNKERPSNQTSIWDIIGHYTSRPVTRSFYVNGVVSFQSWLRISSNDVIPLIGAWQLNLQWQFRIILPDGVNKEIDDAYARRGYEVPGERALSGSVGPYTDLFVEEGSMFVVMVLYQGNYGDIDFLFGGKFDNYMSIPCDYMELDSGYEVHEGNRTVSMTTTIIDAFGAENIRNATATVIGPDGICYNQHTEACDLAPTLDLEGNLSEDTLLAGWCWEYDEVDRGKNFTVRVVIMDNSSNEWISLMEFHIRAPPGGPPLWLIALLTVLAVAGGIAGTQMYRQVKLGGYEIVQVYLVYYDGRLISHVYSEELAGGDEDIFAGMFTAIQNFVEDVFKGKRGSTLDKLEIGENNILIERGPYVYLAVVVAGYPWDEIRKEMRKTLDRIESAYSNQLGDWDGTHFEGPMETLLEELLKKKGRGKVKRGITLSMVQGGGED